MNYPEHMALRLVGDILGTATIAAIIIIVLVLT